MDFAFHLWACRASSRGGKGVLRFGYSSDLRSVTQGRDVRSSHIFD